MATRMWDDGAAIAVADGVGSVPQARIGAEAAVQAAILVAGAWIERSVELERVPPLINKQWQVLLSVPPPLAASTVCVVAVRTDGAWLATSIGDSIFHILTTSRTSTTPDQSAFGDTTHALSDVFVASSWSSSEGGVDDRLIAALTMTDGIGHDIDVSHLPRLMDAVAAITRQHGSGEASAQLEASLNQWGTPAHTDDKSIACLIVDGPEDA